MDSRENADKPRDWHDIAEQASHERDPEKLLELTRQLTEAFDLQNKKPVNKFPDPRRQRKSATGLS